ncbi:MAG TPA: pilin [Lysobacter sp.]|nr:pilin [Lysobacter sp.]
MQTKNEHGFTLIELMIVVAIIAVLAAIAVPAYQDYIARAQVTEGLALATSAKAGLVDYYNDRGVFPADNNGAHMPSPASINGRYVTSVSVGNGDGSIRILFSPNANARIQGQELLLAASAGGGSVHWTCSGVDRRYLPTPCN